MENSENNSLPSSEEKSKQTQKIKSSIKDLEKELRTIQNSCTHKDYKVKNCPKENSEFALRRVCTECEKEIGYPSQEEIDNWAKS
jgi:septal ring factor EnvC (AmiA/AmiB activator)